MRTRSEESDLDRSGSTQNNGRGAAVQAAASGSVTGKEVEQRAWSRMFGSLGVRNFRVLWIGMLFSMAAIQMNMVTRAWLAYELTGDATAIGLVAISRGIPQFLCAPLGGAVADRVAKRTLLTVTQVSLVALSLIAAVLVHLDIIELWHLLVIGVIQGALFPFTMPTRTAFISDLVSDERLTNAIALDSTGRNLNRVLAPALAGVLIAWHPASTFYMMAVFYVLSTFLVLRLPSGSPHRRDDTQRSVFDDIAFGFRYLRRTPTLLILMATTFVVVLIGMPFQHLLPVFQQDVLHVDERQLGLMYTAVGLGAIIGSLGVAYVGESPRQQLIMVLAGITFGGSLLLFALSTTYWLSLAFLVLVGFASQGFLTINKTLVMLQTDRELYGRVMSMYMMSFSLVPLSLLPISAFVDGIGAPVTLAGVGVLLVAMSVLIGSVQAAIRRRMTTSAASGTD